MADHITSKSLLVFPSDFVVLDLETTGCSPTYDEIIEISALRIRNGQLSDIFHSLVKPYIEISSFISEYTGITNDMVSNAPRIQDILSDALGFIGADIVVGHNVIFDIRFLADAAQKHGEVVFANDYVDTMRISRRLLPEHPHHRLCDIADFLGAPGEVLHRAEADCRTTLFCFDALKDIALDKFGSLDNFSKAFSTKKHTDLRTLTTENSQFDEDHPLFGKVCVFTGALEHYTRDQAAQMVVDVGGLCENDVTKRTNYLILGNNDYCKSIKGGKSNKHKKAEANKLKGYDIEIIPEEVFYSMVEVTMCDYISSAAQDFFDGNPFEKFISIPVVADDAVSVVFKSLKLFGCEKKMGGYLVTVKNEILDGIQLPPCAQVKNVKSLKDASRVLFPGEVNAVFKDFIRDVLSNCPAFIDEYYIPEDTFDCCSRFEQCSDALRCIHPDPLFAKGCSYRKQLKNGIVFCGKNRNID